MACGRGARLLSITGPLLVVAVCREVMVDTAPMILLCVENGGEDCSCPAFSLCVSCSSQSLYVVSV